MKKTFAVFSILLFAQAAAAGTFQPYPVEVEINDGGAGSASGDTQTARSEEGQSNIGCGFRAYNFEGAEPYSYGFCQARNAEGVSAFCHTEEPVLLESIKSLSDYSFISFDFDADGNCLRVGFSTQSLYLNPEAE